MFRCITRVRGLIIDIDSFQQIDISVWESLSQKIKCVFLTSSIENEKMLGALVSSDNILRFERYLMIFAPSKKIHSQSLKQLRLKTSEVAYVSSNHRFICNALKFMSGTIWINPSNPTYNEVSSCPDIICDDLPDLEKILDLEVTGLFGEVAISPLEIKRRSGFILSFNYIDSDFKVQIFSAGRYYGYDHYMSQLHPFSSAIYLNKQEGKNYFGAFNDTFAKIYSIIVRNIMKESAINCVCHVPTKPSKADRFKLITEQISKENSIENVSINFICIKDYPSQKNLSAKDRYNNVKNVFQYNGNLNRKNVVLIDDVMTTGATIRSCVEQLYKQGANSVLVLVLAVNQINGSYWSSSQPLIHCPNCNAKMHLLVNSQTRKFFYSCYEKCLPNSKWGQSLSFESAWDQLIINVDSEFPQTDFTDA